VSRPLRILHEWGIIHLTNYYRPWFTHSAGEGLQYVRILQGDNPPEHLRSFMEVPSMDERPDLTSLFALRAVDLVVVEISLMRSLTVGPHFVHLPRVARAAQEVGLLPSDVLAKQGIGWPDGHPLAPLGISFDTEADVAGHLVSIQDSVGKPRVMTVDHIFARDARGNPLPTREEISATLASIEQKYGFSQFRTRPVIERHGFDVATHDGYHYNEDFEKVIATHYWASINRLI
jgi:hypothetical protein